MARRGHSVTAAGQRTCRNTHAFGGPPPNGMYGLMCCRNRMTSVSSQSSSVSRWQNSIRAWDSAEPQRTIRLLGRGARGWTGIPRHRTGASGFLLLACLTRRVRNVTRSVAWTFHDRPLCCSPEYGRASEPSCGRARHLATAGPIQAAPRADGCAGSKTNAARQRGAMARKDLPASHYSTTMDQFHQGGAMAVRQCSRRKREASRIVGRRNVRDPSA